MTQACSLARHPANNLLVGKAGVTGDSLKAHVGFPISELAQPLPGRVRQDVSLRRRDLPQASECPLGAVAHPQIRNSQGAESAAASCRIAV